MNQDIANILQKTREISGSVRLRNITMRQIADRIGVPYETLKEHFSTKQALVRQALAFEREGFKSIFDQYDFDGTNAIDILMIVSREVSQRYRQVSPSLTLEIKKYFPDLYEEHLKARIDFIFSKITINLTKGINQGMYRNDLSIELVARLYISRLLDIHDPNFFPPDRFSFSTLFQVMFEDFIRSIATPEGLSYYENRREKLDFVVA
ncbi:MAG TPA: TetR/AcrR family transcriptional regulator [Bacteroidales bacterium]|nr:TetR/AcrR family transcriptional regulator [Bacteroidales bacterium]HRZ75932.1 TetR/AcrR family transcriptional regulator [Bacteroidales bacterium]